LGCPKVGATQSWGAPLCLLKLVEVLKLRTFCFITVFLVIYLHKPAVLFCLENKIFTKYQILYWTWRLTSEYGSCQTVWHCWVCHKGGKVQSFWLVDISQRNTTQFSLKVDQGLLGDFDFGWDCNLWPPFPWSSSLVSWRYKRSSRSRYSNRLLAMNCDMKDIEWCFILFFERIQSNHTMVGE
jgi:hypothetical protein